MLADLSYPPIPIFEVGPLRLSLHGVMAGVGFVAGAWLMLREARRRGFDVEKITSVLSWALVGSLLGARFFTVPAHLDEGLLNALDPFSTYSIMGGFAGGILVGGWRMRMLGLNVLTHMDMASFGLALGTVIGRIGDLLIVEHLGGRTNFFLGYRLKPGYDVAPQHDILERFCETNGECGPYHHAGLYDLLGAAMLLGLLYLVARNWPRIRYGVLFLTWMGWYGIQRFLIDFTRNTDIPNADATLGPLTWNQWTGLTIGVLAFATVVWIVVREKTPIVSHEQDLAYGAEPLPRRHSVTTDTAPIREEERFDEDRVATHLRANLTDLPDDAVIEFAQFPGGKANLTYSATIDGREYVLRRPPLGPVAPGSHDMVREHRVLSVLHEVFPLAPRAHHLCTDESVMGKPFFVMERRHGHVIRGTWPSGLDDSHEMKRTIAGSMVDALAALHSVDYGALGLGDLGRPDGFVERQVSGWTDRWHRARGDDIPAMDELAAAIAEAPPAPQRAALIHNDFKLNNTMVGDDGHLVAVFDWDMATTGDPLVDLGTTLSYWEGPPELAVVDPPDGVVLDDALTASQIIERYGEATGLDVSGIAWYRALASFRIAVIVQQIYIRYVRGQTTDERFAPLGLIVEPIARAGLDVLARG